MTVIKITRLIGLCIILAIAVEAVITYSDKSVYENYEEKELELEKFYSSSQELIQFSANGIEVHNYEEVSIIQDCNMALKSLSVKLTCKGVVKGQIFLKDEGMKQYWQHGTQFNLLPGGVQAIQQLFLWKAREMPVLF